MAEPSTPDRETREQLLDVLAELVARGGAASLLLPPVEPGADAFPEPWAPTRAGVALLLRRLLWHAGIEREVVLEDRRAGGAPPTERKPATRVEVVEVRGPGERPPAGAAGAAVFALGFVGDDDVAGTLAHEVGAVHAVCHRPQGDDPYRTAEPPVLALDPDVDLVRGSIATVYLGLGVLAANAAYQQYSGNGRFNGGYVPLEYHVLRAGHVPMSGLAFLLAVQAIVRGEESPPAGLEPPQKDEVSAWMAALRGREAELRARLGVPGGATPGTRPPVEAFPDSALADDPVPEKTAFRWRTNRGGVGMLAGAVLGVGLAAAVASRGGAPWFVFGGSGVGHVIGRKVRVPRCSACATVVAPEATRCPRCGATLRGDIDDLSERLEAEERLDDDAGPPGPVG